MNIIVSFLSAFTFYLSPMLLGRATLVVLKRSPLKDISVFAMFAIGSLILYLLAFASSGITHILGYTPTASGIRLWTGVLAIVTVLVNLLRLPSIHVDKKSILHGLVLFGLSIVVFVIWKWDSPYPMSLAWDMHEHQTLVNVIQQGNLTFQTSALSDTFQFNAYPTLFHVLLALPQALFTPDILGFWWSIEYFHLLTTIGISYVIARTLTGNRSIGLLSALIGAFIYETSVAYTSLSLMPQTIAGVWSVWVFVYLMEKTHLNQRIDGRAAVPVLLFVFLTHYIIGAVTLALLVALALLYRIYPRIRRIHRFALLVAIPLAVYLMLGWVSALPAVATLNANEATYFSQGFLQKLWTIRTIYGYSLFLLLPVGVYALFKLRTQSSFSLFVVTGAFVGAALSPFPYIMKVWVIGRFAVHTVMAVGLWKLLSTISNTFVRSFAVFMVTVSFGLVFILNTTQWKDATRYRGQATQVSSDEIRAAQYLKERYGDIPRIMLLSDPATQYVLESLSGVNSQGGAYMNRETRSIVNQVLAAQSNRQLLHAFASLSDDVLLEKPTTVLLVLSGRTVEWLGLPQNEQMSIAVNVWSPKSLSLNGWKTIQNFQSRIQPEEGYRNESMVMYRIPIIPGEAYD